MSYFKLFWDQEKRLYWLQDHMDQNLGAMLDQPEFAQSVLAAFQDQQKLVRLMQHMSTLRSLLHEIEEVIHGRS